MTCSICIANFSNVYAVIINLRKIEATPLRAFVHSSAEASVLKDYTIRSGIYALVVRKKREIGLRLYE